MASGVDGPVYESLRLTELRPRDSLDSLKEALESSRWMVAGGVRKEVSIWMCDFGVRIALFGVLAMAFPGVRVTCSVILTDCSSKKRTVRDGGSTESSLSVSSSSVSIG